MRNFLFLAVLAGVVPILIARPYIGVLIWTWLSFMNPHREVYGAAQNWPLNYWVAILTLASWLFMRERRTPLHGTTLWVLLAFFGWTCVTTLTALDPTISVPLWQRTAKSFVLVLIVMALMNSKVRIQAILWVICISLGYYALKGAGFTLIHGGGARIFGPEDSMIADNNALALALVMTLPLLNYLRSSSSKRIVGLALFVVLGACAITVLGTYSRGGLVALIVVAAVVLLRSRARVLVIGTAVALIYLLPIIVPQQWYARMSTIGQYSEDASFKGRTEAWRTSFNLAVARPLVGGGFHSIENSSVFARYSGSFVDSPRAAHSIYFEVLGDQGFVGLFLYLMMVLVALRNTHQAILIAKRRDELLWAADLGRMMQASLVGFLVGGGLLSMAYYDLFLVLVGLSSNLLMLARRVEQAHILDDIPQQSGIARVPA